MFSFVFSFFISEFINGLILILILGSSIYLFLLLISLQLFLSGVKDKLFDVNLIFDISSFFFLNFYSVSKFNLSSNLFIVVFSVKIVSIDFLSGVCYLVSILLFLKSIFLNDALDNYTVLFKALLILLKEFLFSNIESYFSFI